MSGLRKLILLATPDGLSNAAALANFARLMGVPNHIECRDADLSVLLDCLDKTARGAAGQPWALALSATLLDSSTAAEQLLATAAAHSAPVFLYDCGARASLHLPSFPPLELSSLPPDRELRFALPPTASAFSGVLAGLDFSTTLEKPLPVFDPQRLPAAAEPLLTADDQPFFLLLPSGTVPIYLLSGPLPNPSQTVDRTFDLAHHYAALLPALFFLRRHFPSCWQPATQAAQLIIDDPLIGKRYGQLDLLALTDSLRRHNRAATLAFIPWNGWRTGRRAATQLLGSGSPLGLCVHGCDHTNREFASPSVEELTARAVLAQRRMQRLSRRTAVGFAPVMVFPQGRFSSVAPAALRAAGFLAAVNSTVLPGDLAADALTLGDLLSPALTRFAGLPLFLRHYPQRFFDLAFSLYLGGTAILVAHHQDFAAGPAPWEELAARLQNLAPALEWPPLEHLLSRVAWRRELADSRREFRFFTPRFSFFAAGDPGGTPQHYRLSREEPDPAAVARVLLDGRERPFSLDSGLLVVDLEAAPGEFHLLQVEDRRQTPFPLPRRPVLYNCQVFGRRLLSELRDNRLSRHPRLLRLAQSLVGWLGLTGSAAQPYPHSPRSSHDR